MQGLEKRTLFVRAPIQSPGLHIKGIQMNNLLPATGFVSLRQIIGDKNRNIPAILPIGRSTWLNGVNEGRYPAPVKISERRVGWHVSDIQSLLNSLK